jgi:hypothetical protein
VDFLLSIKIYILEATADLFKFSNLVEYEKEIVTCVYSSLEGQRGKDCLGVYSEPTCSPLVSVKNNGLENFWSYRNLNF